MQNWKKHKQKLLTSFHQWMISDINLYLILMRTSINLISYMSVFLFDLIEKVKEMRAFISSPNLVYVIFGRCSVLYNC